MNEACGAKLTPMQPDGRPARISCSRCSLGELCLPRRLAAEEISRLETLVDRSRPLHAGEHIYIAGAPFSTIAVVRVGCIKSYLVNEAGEEQVLDFHLPGEIIGLDAIHGGAYLSSAVSLDTSAICQLNFAQLSNLAGSMSGLLEELFDVMSHRIANLEQTFCNSSAEQRFALFLESLSRRYSRRGYSAREFTLAMPRRDIANYLNLASETVSRVISRMNDQGLIEVKRRQVRILDADALHDISRHCDASMI